MNFRKECFVLKTYHIKKEVKYHGTKEPLQLDDDYSKTDAHQRELCTVVPGTADQMLRQDENQ